MSAPVNPCVNIGRTMRNGCDIHTPHYWREYAVVVTAMRTYAHAHHYPVIMGNNGYMCKVRVPKCHMVFIAADDYGLIVGRGFSTTTRVKTVHEAARIIAAFLAD